MNTMAVVCSVDDREEIACSYSTKLIQGFEILSRLTKEDFYYITFYFCFLFPSSLDAQKQQKGNGVFLKLSVTPD